MESIKKYDIVFKDVGYRSLGASQGLHYVAKLCESYKFKSVLDVGCGPGWSVLELLNRGKEARGVEPCKYLFGQELRVPAGLGIVKEGEITSIPFPADSFDLVFCTDVLEHLVESEVKQALSELVRVSKKYIFCSICSTEAVMFPAMKLHQTVKPREWWEKQFSEFKLKQIKVEDRLGYLFVRIP
jgi:ubiquinone/menaquinone biosynthesis C-methylase UbiE